MSTKTLSLPEKVYVRFDSDRRDGESFNDVITRITEKKSLSDIVGYQRISGMHTSTIVQNQDITAQKLYPYPCAGTGGHTESTRIYGNVVNENASRNGYAEDGDKITFDSSFTLEAGKTYNYVIETGSYPQIHHTDNISTPAGFITCSEFRDVNGKRYSDWIPAIRLT